MSEAMVPAVMAYGTLQAGKASAAGATAAGRIEAAEISADALVQQFLARRNKAISEENTRRKVAQGEKAAKYALATVVAGSGARGVTGDSIHDVLASDAEDYSEQLVWMERAGQIEAAGWEIQALAAGLRGSNRAYAARVGANLQAESYITASKIKASGAAVSGLGALAGGMDWGGGGKGTSLMGQPGSEYGPTMPTLGSGGGSSWVQTGGQTFY